MNIFKTPEGYLYSNKALLALFIPLLIEYGLEFFMGFADSVMVASLGEVAISGVSLVDFLVQLLIFSFSALLIAKILCGLTSLTGSLYS